MSKSIGLLQGFILCWQVGKPHYGWNSCRSFGIKQVSSSCCISNAHSRWSKKTSFDTTFPPARPPAPYDHRLPPVCRVGCSADFPDSIKGIHLSEFLYMENKPFLVSDFYFFKLPPPRPLARVRTAWETECLVLVCRHEAGSVLMAIWYPWKNS